MVENKSRISIPDKVIMSKIYLIRGKKLMLDRDLAELYGIETRILKQTVRRNTKDTKYLSVARKALLWCLNNQYDGPDKFADGGIIGISRQSGVIYRPWFKLACSYSSGFFGLAVLEELSLRKIHKIRSSMYSVALSHKLGKQTTSRQPQIVFSSDRNGRKSTKT